MYNVIAMGKGFEYFYVKTQETIGYNLNEACRVAKTWRENYPIIIDEDTLEEVPYVVWLETVDEEFNRDKKLEQIGSALAAVLGATALYLLLIFTP